MPSLPQFIFKKILCRPFTFLLIPQPPPHKVWAILTSCICNTNAAGKYPNSFFFSPHYSTVLSVLVNVSKFMQERIITEDVFTLIMRWHSLLEMLRTAHWVSACCLYGDPFEHLNLMSDTKFERKGLGDSLYNNAEAAFMDGCEDDLNQNPFLTAFSKSSSLI